MRLTFSKYLIRISILLFITGVIFVVPSNSSLVFGYGATLGTSTPSCNDSYAGGAPTLLSAKATGPNQVTLTWSKAADPVTHYVVSYGLSAGNPLYGNPNVGGKDTTSYTVGSLSGGTTYYFRVRAGNGCNAGPYSNEMAASTGGRVIPGPAAGFIPGVLGAAKTRGQTLGQTQEQTPQPSQSDFPSEATPTPQQQPKTAPFVGGILGAILSFLGRLFGR